MNELKVIIGGTRTFKDYRTLEEVCDKILTNYRMTNEITILSPASRGDARLGEKYAWNRGYKIEKYEPDWDLYRRYTAGKVRNEKMVMNANLLIAIWDGESYGTKNLLGTAKEWCLETYLYIYPKQLLKHYA